MSIEFLRPINGFNAYPGIEHDPEYQLKKFDTIEMLLDSPYVKGFSEIPSFYRYSIDNPKDPNTPVYLMAEYQDGHEWWVVGYLNKNLDLPRWEPKHKK